MSAFGGELEQWRLKPPAVSIVLINKSTRSLLCNSISDQQVNRAWNWKRKNLTRLAGEVEDISFG